MRLTILAPAFPEPELPRVFERFHRVEGLHGRSHEGSGIGLALVHELVKLHGGELGVESQVGRGSPIHGLDSRRHEPFAARTDCRGRERTGAAGGQRLR